MAKRDLGVAAMVLGGLLVPVLLCCGTLTVAGLVDAKETEWGT